MMINHDYVPKYIYQEVNMTNYIDNMKNAYQFTKSLSIDCEEPIFKEKQYFSTLGEKTDFINSINLKYFGFDSILYLQAKCHLITDYIQPFIEKELGCKSYFTIGGCHIRDSTCNYKLTKDSAKQLLKGQNQSDIENTHAWLTLDSGEVIDLTAFATTKLTSFLHTNRISTNDLRQRHQAGDSSSVLAKFKECELSADVYFGLPDGSKKYNLHPTVIGKTFLTIANPNHAKSIAGMIEENRVYCESIIRSPLSKEEKYKIENFFNVI